MARVKFRPVALVATLVVASAAAGAPPAAATAGVAANCFGDLVASHALVDRDGLGATTELGRLRVDVFYSAAAGGTTCAMTVGGNGTASGPVPMVAMLLTDGGEAALDRGEYRYHAAVTATGTAGRCVRVYGETRLLPFGPEVPASDWYFLAGDAREYCNPSA
ncbi:hypothetical protein SAMN04488242_2185 [Tessaracoccus oleiagri]|uniref:Spore-associated protein A n=1 Tax=Tessaracoccus oleiagri TaxID=686624 RepID=A0A1G9LMS3_9ACTN|nr:hypothetical protein SAMN04488242_2185 [Tessaracoccus oleiagri]